MNTEPKKENYAQQSVFSVMKSGGWFTVRQLTDLCRVSDPRATIRTLIKRGYKIEKRAELNSKRVHFKSYRLVLEEGAE